MLAERRGDNLGAYAYAFAMALAGNVALLVLGGAPSFLLPKASA